MAETVWVLAFEAVEQRDNFYEWRWFRMDRWPAWDEFARKNGSEKLTHKPLAVMAAALQPQLTQRLR